MAQEEIELHLRGLVTPSGNISLGDLAPLAEALQLLATRIVRDVGGQTGPGRTIAPLEQIARLQLVGLRAGSTTLVISAGDDTLAIDHPYETGTFDRFWDVVDGLKSGNRPAWVTAPVAEAALSLTAALAVADDVEFRGSRTGRVRRPIRLTPDHVDRSSWRMETETTRRSGVTVTGILDLVDLRRRSFRIRDDVGHDITLEEVENAARAGALVGQRVAANGEAILTDRGQPARVRRAIVTALAVPKDWSWLDREDTERPATAVVAEAIAVPGPLFSGVEGITDDEVDEFLASLRG